MNTFSQLNINPKIYSALEVCGYEKPTAIQAKSIPIILEGRDIIGATETGDGKTAAFLLPTLHRLAEKHIPQSLPRVLILAPTRELSNQITLAIRKYGKFLSLKTANIIGGASYRDQEKMLQASPDIIVATPGRLIDHLRNKRINLSNIEMLIIDEADRMLDMNFIDDINQIAKKISGKKQTLLFTATLDKNLQKNVAHLLKDPVVIDLSSPNMVPSKIKQQLFIANNQQQKTSFLENLLQTESVYKAIIFSATKMNADKIAYHLRSQGHNALALHGDLKQHVRKKSLEKLRTGKVQYLVATDVASRGIDIDDISHVINFDLPRSSEDYIHRVGRTGRAGRDGIAISLATLDDRRYIASIERHVGTKLQLINFDREETLASASPFKEEKPFENKRRRPKKSFSHNSRPPGREQNKKSFSSSRKRVHKKSI